MGKKQSIIDYEKIAEMESFKTLAKKKNRFLWTVTGIFLFAYILLPILTSYTNVLHQKAIGDITWVWIYSAALFVMTWSLAHFYVRKASTYDKEARKIIEEYESGEPK